MPQHQFSSDINDLIEERDYLVRAVNSSPPVRNDREAAKAAARTRTARQRLIAVQFELEKRHSRS